MTPTQSQNPFGGIGVGQERRIPAGAEFRYNDPTHQHRGGWRGREEKVGIERPIANWQAHTRDNYWDGKLFNVYTLHPDAGVDITSNSLFVMQVLEFLFTLAIFAVAILIVTEQVKINGYAFLIAMIIIWFFMSAFHFRSTARWTHQAAYAHHHNNEIFMSFFFWFFIILLFCIILGVWLLDKENSQCCGFEGSQPNRFSLINQEYTVYLIIFGFIMNGSMFISYSIFRALISHYYPEKRDMPPSYFTELVSETSDWAAQTGSSVPSNE